MKEFSFPSILYLPTLTFLATLPILQAANCTYTLDHESGKYTCSLKNVHIILEDSPLDIEGLHHEGFTDDSVQVVEITHSVLYFIQSAIFDKFRNLEEFSVHDGEVRTITPNALDSCLELEAFAIENAELTELPARAFQHCHKLQQISLIKCQISALPRDAFYGVDKELRRLDLSSNLLKSLSYDTLSGLIRLRQLNLAENAIEAIDEFAFGDLGEVESLLLHSNEISSELPATVFSALKSLTELDLRHNSIAQLNPAWFDQLGNLQLLDLDENDILELPAGIFAPLANLRNLYLDRNGIEQLKSASFAQHKAMAVLTIDHNRLNSIQPGFFDSFPSLVYFHAMGNICIDNFLFNDDEKIDFSSEAVGGVLKKCYNNHETPKRFLGKYWMILWIGLGVAVGVCVLVYVLHFCFVKRSDKLQIEVVV